MSTSSTVVIAMSGGVDSSVAAALLVKQGYRVIGMMMRLWSEPGAEASNRCCTPEAMALARRVAARLSIPFYAIDAQQVFYDTVVKQFIDGYAQHITPNPCLTCNRFIRWEFLLNKALDLGADYLATGHYARLNHHPTGSYFLQRGLDSAKDQSYVLHVLSQEQLKHALFPLGDLTKTQVRELARQFELPVADRPESQDLCFLGQADYRDFLRRYAPATHTTGPILDRHGNQLGEHQGLAFHTIGQRKGLRIAAPQPLYVIDKDPIHNALIVGVAAELGKDTLIAGQVNWISGAPPSAPFRAQIKIRYKASLEPGLVTILPEQQIHIQFDHKIRDITPGQAAVLYDGDICLGGGLIW